MKIKFESKDRQESHTHTCTYVVQIGGKSISINLQVTVKRTLQQMFVTFKADSCAEVDFISASQGKLHSMYYHMC